MARLDETILGTVKKLGPSTPLEIARQTGANSMIVSAILIDAVSQKKILRTKRKFGESQAYYYPDQQKQAQKRVSDVLTQEDKQILDRLMKENVIAGFEVEKPEYYSLVNLEDLVIGFNIDHEGQAVRCWAVPTLGEEAAMKIANEKLVKKLEELGKAEPKPQPEPEPKQPDTPEPAKEVKEVKKEVEEVKKEVEKKVEPKAKVPKEEKQTKLVEQVKKETEKVTKKKEEPVEDAKEQLKEEIRQEVMEELKGSFRDNVLNWFEVQDIDVQNERMIKKGKVYELEIRVPTKLGKQTYLVRVVDNGKKALGQKELSDLGMEAVSKKMPALIISKTGFAKSAKKYWEKELQDLITLIDKDDLE